MYRAYFFFTYGPPRNGLVGGRGTKGNGREEKNGVGEILTYGPPRNGLVGGRGTAPGTKRPESSM